MTSHVSARASAVHTLGLGMDPQSIDKCRTWADQSCSHRMLRLAQVLELFWDCSRLYRVSLAHIGVMTLSALQKAGVSCTARLCIFLR